jgi:hypothetical protein
MYLVLIVLVKKNMFTSSKPFPIQLTNVTNAGIKTALFNASHECINDKTYFYTVNATMTYNKNSKQAK